MHCISISEASWSCLAQRCLSFPSPAPSVSCHFHPSIWNHSSCLSGPFQSIVSALLMCATKARSSFLSMGIFTELGWQVLAVSRLRCHCLTLDPIFALEKTILVLPSFLPLALFCSSGSLLGVHLAESSPRASPWLVLLGIRDQLEVLSPSSSSFSKSHSHYCFDSYFHPFLLCFRILQGSLR